MNLTKGQRKQLSMAKLILPFFMGTPQIVTMLTNIEGEEGEYFFDKLIEMAETINTMAKTYEQDGKGDSAIVYLHYFMRGFDWYITEKDMETEQLQAFGLADLGHGGELGYISIVEILTASAELDLHFTPKTLAEVKANLQ